jgi:phosphohistidine swiveling domain-containing protein
MPPIPDSKRDPMTPPEVKVTMEPREPISGPTLGIPVVVDSSQATNRLVTIGDSLTHGFQSGAIYNTGVFSCDI